LNESIYPTSVKNLFILPSGPIPPNPAELIETDEMEELFRNAREDFDYIILDTPPIALVADSLSLAKYADMTLYIVRQNYSHKRVIDIVNSMKTDATMPNIGILINDIKPSKKLGINYYYGYGKSYSYGYYYYKYAKHYYREEE